MSLPLLESWMIPSLNSYSSQIQRVIGEEDVARFRRELGEEAGGDAAESDDDDDDGVEGSGESSSSSFHDPLMHWSTVSRSSALDTLHICTVCYA